MKRHFIVIGLLAVLTANASLTAQTPVYLDDKQPIEARVRDALSRMTLEEKVRICAKQIQFSGLSPSRYS